MARVTHDNELLANCVSMYDRIIQAGKMALIGGLTGVGIGCAWYLCVAFRAGVL